MMLDRLRKAQGMDSFDKSMTTVTVKDARSHQQKCDLLTSETVQKAITNVRPSRMGSGGVIRFEEGNIAGIVEFDYDKSTKTIHIGWIGEDYDEMARRDPRFLPGRDLLSGRIGLGDLTRLKLELRSMFPMALFVSGERTGGLGAGRTVLRPLKQRVHPLTRLCRLVQLKGIQVVTKDRHEGEPCQQGWTQARTGCTPKRSADSSSARGVGGVEGGGADKEKPEQQPRLDRLKPETSGLYSELLEELFPGETEDERTARERRTTARGGRRGAESGDESEAAGGGLASEATGTDSGGDDTPGQLSSKPAGRATTKTVSASKAEALRRIDRVSGLVQKALRKAYKVGDVNSQFDLGTIDELVDMVHSHVKRVGVTQALKDLGREKVPEEGSDKPLAYEGVWQPESYFFDDYLKSCGIEFTLSSGGMPSKDLALISSWTPLHRAEVEGEKGESPFSNIPVEYRPPDPTIPNKLEEAKRIPGLETSEDINKLLGRKVTQIDDEVIAKLDKTYGKGKWIVKSYGAQGYAGFGIFFPERAQERREEAETNIWHAERGLKALGCSILRNKKGEAIGIHDDNDGKSYRFNTKQYDSLEGLPSWEWGNLVKWAARDELGAALPGSPADELRYYGYIPYKNRNGRTVGVINVNNPGTIYHPDDESMWSEIEDKEGFKAQYWAKRTCLYQDTFDKPGGKPNLYMAQPAFKAVGVTEADRAEGNTWETSTEGRVHVITKNGKAIAVPNATFARRGDNLPAVFETPDIKRMQKAAVDAINAMPESDRQGHVFAPDVMLSNKGYRVVEANPEAWDGGSQWLESNPFAIDAYVSSVLGREPAHVRFIRRLLSEEKQRKALALRRVIQKDGNSRSGQPCKPGWSAARTGCTPLSRLSTTRKPSDDNRVYATKPARGNRHIVQKLPNIRQTKPYTCGVASAMGIARMFGVKGPNSIDDWEKALGATPEHGTPSKNIVSFLRSQGLDVEERHNMTLDDLDNLTKEGRPVITPIQEYGWPSRFKANDAGHYVTVIGRSMGMTVVQDPSMDNQLGRPGGSVGGNRSGELGSVQAGGRSVIWDKTFNKVWHDKDDDGNEYKRYGIIVGPPKGSDKTAHRVITKEESRVDASSDDIKDSVIAYKGYAIVAPRDQLENAKKVIDSYVSDDQEQKKTLLRGRIVRKGADATKLIDTLRRARFVVSGAGDRVMVDADTDKKQDVFRIAQEVNVPIVFDGGSFGAMDFIVRPQSATSGHIVPLVHKPQESESRTGSIDYREALQEAAEHGIPASPIFVRDYYAQARMHGRSVQQALQDIKQYGNISAIPVVNYRRYKVSARPIAGMPGKWTYHREIAGFSGSPQERWPTNNPSQLYSSVQAAIEGGKEQIDRFLVGGRATVVDPRFIKRSLNRLYKALAKAETHAGEACKPGWTQSRTGSLSRIAKALITNMEKSITNVRHSMSGTQGKITFDVLARPKESFPGGIIAGNVILTYHPDTKTIRVEWLGYDANENKRRYGGEWPDWLEDMSDISLEGQVGLGDLSVLREEAKRMFPEAIFLSGNRIGGIRLGEFRRPLKSFTKAETHSGEPCKPGWTQSRTGCTPAGGGGAGRPSDTSSVTQPKPSSGVVGGGASTSHPSPLEGTPLPASDKPYYGLQELPKPAPTLNRLRSAGATPTKARQDYIKAIHHLGGVDGRVSPSAIAGRLHVSAPSVTGMLKKLARDGLIEYTPGRAGISTGGVKLTDSGKSEARKVVRRHRLVESLLTKLGADWSDVHQEAEALEHAISPEVEQLLSTFLDNPKEDPHGHAIPTSTGELESRQTKPLHETLSKPGESATVREVSDDDPKRLMRFAELGIKPGARVTLVSHEPIDDIYHIEVNGKPVTTTRTGLSSILASPDNAASKALKSLIRKCTVITKEGLVGGSAKPPASPKPLKPTAHPVGTPVHTPGGEGHVAAHADIGGVHHTAVIHGGAEDRHTEWHPSSSVTPKPKEPVVNDAAQAHRMVQHHAEQHIQATEHANNHLAEARRLQRAGNHAEAEHHFAQADHHMQNADRHTELGNAARQRKPEGFALKTMRIVMRKGSSHTGEPCKVGWSASRTGCTPTGGYDVGRLLEGTSGARQQAANISSHRTALPASKPLSRLRSAQQETASPSGPSQPLSGNTQAATHSSTKPKLRAQSTRIPAKATPPKPQDIDVVASKIQRAIDVHIYQHKVKAEKFVSSMASRADQLVKDITRDVWSDCPSWIAQTAAGITGALDATVNIAKDVALAIYAPILGTAAGGALVGNVTGQLSNVFGQIASTTAQRTVANIGEAVNPPICSMLYVATMSLVGGIQDKDNEGIWSAMAHKAGKNIGYILAGE